MKILLVYLQPKDIPQILEPLKRIPCDKLYLKYIPYPFVYRAAYNFIQAHSEYTHIFWLQNDIMLSLEQFEACIKKLIENNLSLLGLSMNVDGSRDGRNLLAFTTKPFDIQKKKKIDWAKRGEYSGLIKVFHNGGPFLIERMLYLHYPLHGDTKTGFNADIYHGLELNWDNIEYYLDSKANLNHLRYIEKMQVGRKQAITEFVRL